ncbi:hypothetical protein HHI36_004203 [Cryptolaemus montrouzieri]|uniref:Uncharacterized protein n=1 Tax=Cryptolaemus montrouzieri TaxID=559131 RepID=A0ABD2NQI4_9CUCU
MLWCNMVWLDQDDLLENIQADDSEQSVLVDSDTKKKLRSCQFLCQLCRITCVVNGIRIGITAVHKPPPIPKNDFVEDIDNYLETNALGGDKNFELLDGDKNMDLLNIDDSTITI